MLAREVAGTVCLRRWSDRNVRQPTGKQRITMEGQFSSTAIIGSYLFAIGEALEERGLDPEAVFEACGLARPKTNDPMLRVGNAEIERLYRAAVEATGDPCLGLRVGEMMRPGNLHAMGFALLSSTTIRDFAQRLSNFYRVISQNALIRSEERGDEFLIITATAPGVMTCHETQDAFVSLIVNLLRTVSGNTFHPKWLELMRPAPEGRAQDYADYFKCEVRFERPELVIAIEIPLADKRLPGASEELAQNHEQTVMEYLQRIDRGDIVNRVRAIINDDLSSRALNKERVAERLHVSTRSLQLKLAARNTSFQEILDQTRRTQALAYMSRSSVSVTEAAFSLGFSEVSNFTRAFRRWTGMSPSDYRHSLGLDK